jgi:hypothetical protein
VVHDPTGRPWLVCTTDALYGQGPASATGAGLGFDEETYQETVGGERYETQVFYTARAGIRGFPTGHGQRYQTRPAAVSGHRRWCLRVRQGEVAPDAIPEEPL